MLFGPEPTIVEYAGPSQPRDHTPRPAPVSTPASVPGPSTNAVALPDAAPSEEGLPTLPEAAPGPHDSHYLFREFTKMMEEWKR